MITGMADITRPANDLITNPLLVTTRTTDRRTSVVQVCAACHSVYQLHFRDLVGVAYTEDECKMMAADLEFTDGPNDEGEMFDRPGRLADPLPR